ncbi:AI-2E family transporter [Aquicoccus sp. SCR17]|nr:AI-2E family transporter [Carideicomes alvinocaridis]
MTDAPDRQSQALSQAPRPKTSPNWAQVGVFLLLLVGAMAYARAFLMPVVLALLLQLVFSPVRRQLERMGLSTGAAATAIFGLLIAGLVAGALSLAVPASSWVGRAPQIGRELQEKFEDLRGATESMREAAEQIDEIADGEEKPGVQKVKLSQDGNTLSIAMSLPAILAQVMFTLVLLLFLLASGDMFYEKIVHVMPKFRDKRRAIRIAYDIERKLSRYLFSITVINACLGVCVGVALWWFGFPSPALFGVLAFLLNFIPYLGAVLGMGAAFAVGAVSFETLGQTLAGVSAYFVLTTLEGQFVTPYVVGRSLRLNTVVVFLSVTLFAWLWSVVGMLVATPLLVATRTFCEHIPALEKLGHFLSARGDEHEDQEEHPPQNGT